MNLQCLLLLDSRASQSPLTARDKMFFFVNDKIEMWVTISN